MTAPSGASDDEPRDRRAREARRRRRLAAIGDTAAERSADDSDEGWSERDERGRDDDLRRDVPPHHG